MINTNYLNDFNSPIRQINGKVEHITCSTETANGTQIKLENVANKPIEIRAESKNIITRPYYSEPKVEGLSTMINGVSFSVNDDGSITADGTATAQVLYWICQSVDMVEAGETYTVSGCASGGSDTNYLIQVSCGGQYPSDYGTGRNFVAQSNTISIYIVIRSGITVDNLVFKPQLEKGTTATEYTPYVDLAATKPKKNLFDINKTPDFNTNTTATIKKIDDTTVNITSSAYSGGGNGISIGKYPKATKLTISFDYIVCDEVIAAGGGLRLNITAKSGSVLTNNRFTGSGKAIATLEVPETADNQELYFRAGYDVAYKNGWYVEAKYIQIEKGTTATEYEPYTLIPANEINVYGKNLLQFPETFSSFGITMTKGNNGEYIFNGTSTGDALMIIKLPIELPRNNYTLSFNNEIGIGTSASAGGDNPYFALRLSSANGSGWFTSGTLNTPYKTAQISYTHPHFDKGNIYDLLFNVPKGVVLDNFVIKPQLEEGTTATEYEAYKTQVIPVEEQTMTINPFIPTTIAVAPGMMLDITYTKENFATYQKQVKSIKINKDCETGKFFGFGVSQKLTLELLDKERAISVIKENGFKTYLQINENDFVDNAPVFYVDEANRNENTNDLTITAYDLLYAAAAHKISEVSLTSYSVRELASAIATVMGLTLEIRGLSDEKAFDTYFENGANLEGTETFREVLDDIAEYTQTIYYISGYRLVFRRLETEPAATIEKKHYFTLKSQDPITLGSICNTNELGNSVLHNSLTLGMTQYIKDNAFYSKFDDETISQILKDDIDIYGANACPYECSWRGNFLLEIGDKINIVSKDDSLIATYYLNDTLTYRGGFSQKSSWQETENKNETATNSSSLGTVLKQTYAKVDKANKKIEMVVSETSANKNEISILQQDTKSISGSVSSLESKVDSTKETLTDINKKVEATMTDEQIRLAITSEIAKGTSKVETTAGFTFDENGLKVSKTGKDMETQITEDGMIVSKNGSPMLTANSDGVEAINLNASTYLIIGKNSRFEDYGNRTACFWIGG